MAKFRQVPQVYLLTKLLTYWGNMVRNYRGDVHDDDFFDVVRNYFNHDKAVELIEMAYTAQELEEMQQSRSRRYQLNLSDSLDDVFQCIWNNERARGKCRVVLESIREYILADNPMRGEEALERRFKDIRRLMKLSELECEILTLAYVRSQTCFDWPVCVENRDKPLYYAMALDRSYSEVLKAMTAQGRLRKFDLLDDDWDFNCRAIGGYMDGTDAEALERRFYKRCEGEDALPWEFFGELANKDGEVIKRMLSASKGKCNILFYGQPGTGKTSFAKTLAKEMGLAAYEIRQGDEEGRNMRAESRMVGIKIANDKEDPGESLMIVDEADELLRGNSCGFSIFGLEMGGGKSTEKGVMNAILDEMRIPAIWISNAPARAMDEAVRRRFDYSVCFERMNTTQRVSIWKNLVKKYALGGLIPQNKIDDYASKYETSAGGIATVLQNVKKMAPDATHAEALIATLMKSHCKLMGIRDSNTFLPASGYSLEGLNVKGKVGPEMVVRAVRNYFDADFVQPGADRPSLNILLFGAPGTGKTEFVKYLGKTLDRKVLAIKGSEILSKWVGGTEENLAAAFAQAEAEQAILFFDEIDGLVQSRENAHARWEVSQVNELLQQMEDFDGVMVAATNFRKGLDPAIMRRFTFKLEFDYLDGKGKQIFFRKIFQVEPTKEELAALDAIRNLTPGDFHTVRQERFYLAGTQTNLDLIAALKAECVLKQDGSKATKIGF